MRLTKGKHTEVRAFQHADVSRDRSVGPIVGAPQSLFEAPAILPEVNLPQPPPGSRSGPSDVNKTLH